MARLSPFFFVLVWLAAACGPDAQAETQPIRLAPTHGAVATLLPAASGLDATQFPGLTLTVPPATREPTVPPPTASQIGTAATGEASSPPSTASPTAGQTVKPTAAAAPPTRPTAAAGPLPVLVDLNLTHEYQKWNNCGPVSLGVVTTYWGIPRDQYQTAAEVKGAEFDKNVGTAEMQGYLERAGLKAITRVNGTQEELMRLVAAQIPVIVLQWLLKPDNTLVGHYRVVQGYDQRAALFITSDPYTAPHKTYSFADFERWWQPWNHRYIVAYRPEQEDAVRQALGADFDAARNLAAALQASTAAAAANPADGYAWFNLGDDRLASGSAADAVAAYDKAFAAGVLAHFDWYNYGPYEALYRTGNFQRIFELSAPVLKDADNIEEIHYWRGMAWLGLGQKEKAKAELAIAVQLNARYVDAQKELAALQ